MTDEHEQPIGRVISSRPLTPEEAAIYPDADAIITILVRACPTGGGPEPPPSETVAYEPLVHALASPSRTLCGLPMDDDLPVCASRLPSCDECRAMLLNVHPELAGYPIVSYEEED